MKKQSKSCRFLSLSKDEAQLRFVDKLLPSRDWPLILLAAVGLLAIYALNTVLQYVVTYWGHVLGINIETDMRRKIFDHIQKLSFRFFDNNKKALKGDIQYNHVTFGYEQQRKVVHNITLSIAAGETVAFVGPSGAGKTPLCSLLPRFYELDAGSITIDGIDIRQMTLASLRRQIGILQQFDLQCINPAKNEMATKPSKD